MVEMKMERSQGRCRAHLQRPHGEEVQAGCRHRERQDLGHMPLFGSLDGVLWSFLFLGFPCGSAHKESVRNARDLGPIPGLERSPGEGIHYPLQYSGLESSMDCIARGVTKSWTQLSYFHFHFPEDDPPNQNT